MPESQVFVPKVVKEWRSLMTHGGPHATGFAELMYDTHHAVSMTRKDIRSLAPMMKAMGRGKALTFLAVVCPDYGCHTDENGAVRYTFDSLSNGIGLVASRALGVMVDIASHFRDQSLSRSATFVAPIADQEANEANCDRVGLSRAEFLENLAQSQAALRAEAEARGLPLHAPFLTQMNPAGWNRAKEAATALSGQISASMIAGARAARSEFYKRWAGRRLSRQEVDDMLRTQALEYVAVGAYLSGAGRLILGLDSPVMAPFLRIGLRGTPVVYFNRPDY